MLNWFNCCKKKKTHHKGPTIMIQSKDSELIEPPPQGHQDGDFADPRGQRETQSSTPEDEMRLHRTESFSPKSDKKFSV